MVHNYKLRYNDILKIKEQLATTKLGMNKIAKEFNVSLSTIQVINRGETHSDIGEYSHPIRKRKNIHPERVQNQAKKISDEQAIEIFMRLESGESSWHISKDYNCSVTLIDKIKERPMFRHVLMFD